MELRLGGLIIIVLVLSAAAVYTMAVLKGEENAIEMLQNDYPERLINPDREGRRFTFSHGFVMRRDIVELEIRFSFLHYSPPPGTGENASGFENYLEVESVRNLIGGDLLVKDEYEAEFDDHPSPNTIRILDLSRSITPFSPTDSADSIASVFAYKREENGVNLTYYRGISDFFYDREYNVDYIVIARGDNETMYSSGGEPGATIADAPEGGVVVFSDMKKGDVAVIEFSIFPLIDHMPERTWNKNYGRKIIEVVRAYADGELAISVANTVEVDLI